MNESEIQKFEECKSKLDALGKSIDKAQTTVAVLTKQMDTLKARRKQIEESCAKDLGVPIKELQNMVSEKFDNYVKLTKQASEMFEQINQEQDMDGKSN
jgi:archaellum component FlaC